MDKINICAVLKKPEKPFGKNGTKFIQKNNENPVGITKMKKNMIALETDLIMKNGKMTRMRATIKMKLI